MQLHLATIEPFGEKSLELGSLLRNSKRKQNGISIVVGHHINAKMTLKKSGCS